MNLELKELNTLFNDVFKGEEKLTKFINERKGHTGIPENSEGEQGEYNETFHFYKILNQDNLFIKVTKYSDSYGYNEAVSGIEFVVGKLKQITVYEPI